jgi:pimeloyl-ACP methyl ester carboxylesterase
MTPIRFESGGASLYGVLHAAGPQGLAARGVLLCNPFGQEAIRAHRVYRVLADRFARAGFPTLRFDYHATGDSDGDDDEIALGRWIADIHTADAELRRRTACRTTCWMGLRLGATLAARASIDAPEPVERLILWDAVIDGGDWLASLSKDHVAALDRAFFDVDRGSLPVSADPDQQHEAIGFALPAAFRHAVRALDRTTLGRLRCARLDWLAPRSAPPSEALQTTLSQPHRTVSWNTVADTDWNTDEAMNASIVPADVIALALAALEAP